MCFKEDEQAEHIIRVRGVSVMGGALLKVDAYRELLDPFDHLDVIDLVDMIVVNQGAVDESR